MCLVNVAVLTRYLKSTKSECESHFSPFTFSKLNQFQFSGVSHSLPLIYGEKEKTQ